MTQSSSILQLLQSRGAIGITQLDALQEAGCMRLAARIKDLRDDGHHIDTITETTPNGARIARYILTSTKE